jgi:hypothetical protein
MADSNLDDREAFEQMFAYADHVKDVTVGLDGNYVIKSPRPVAGKWYVASECTYCTKVTPFFADASEGRVKFPPDEHFMQTDCYFCEHQTRATPIELRSIQWT